MGCSFNNCVFYLQNTLSISERGAALFRHKMPFREGDLSSQRTYRPAPRSSNNKDLTIGTRSAGGAFKIQVKAGIRAAILDGGME